MIDLSHLVSETFLRRAEWHDELNSTNTRAFELAAGPAIETPYLIGATTQSAGRGRGSNRWWDADGTLMFSVLFDMPDLGIPQTEWPRFSLGTALSVAETIEAFLPHADVGLKWPNDVWIGRQKVCGILIEQPERAAGKLVVGIGLNINTRFANAPDDLRAIATSMSDVSGQVFAMQDVLVRLLQRWDINCAAQRSGDWDLRRLWSRLCVLSGRHVRITSAVGEQTADCQGIADDGALLLNGRDGVNRCYAGTVRIVD